MSQSETVGQQFTTLTKDLGPKKPLVCISGYKKGGNIRTYNANVEGEVTNEPLTVGTVVEGIYEGVKETTFKEEDGSENLVREHMVRANNGSDVLTLLRACSALDNEETGLGAVSKGELVQVTFLGMKATKTKGRKFTNFSVARAINTID